MTTQALLARLALLGSLSVYAAGGQAAWFNTDIHNTTGSVANDYHIKVHSDSQNITIGGNHWDTGFGAVPWPSFSASGEGTQDVGLNWSGATVNSGEKVHVGAYGLPSDFVITESWWTLGGAKLMPSFGQASASFDGLGTTYQVAWVDLYDGANNLIGSQWIQELGSVQPTIFNATSDAIYVSYGFWQTNTPIPIEQLNATDLNRSNFSQFSPIVRLAGVPEPGSLLLFGAGFLGLLSVRRGRPRLSVN